KTQAFSDPQIDLNHVCRLARLCRSARHGCSLPATNWDDVGLGITWSSKYYNKYIDIWWGCEVLDMVYSRETATMTAKQGQARREELKTMSIPEAGKKYYGLS